MTEAGTFTKLMEMQRKKEAHAPPPERIPERAVRPPSAVRPVRDDEPLSTLSASLAPSLPSPLENLGATGSISHSFRLSIAESQWLRRFCDRISYETGRTVSHNLLVRLVMRIADSEWSLDPDANRLRELLDETPEL